MSDPMLLELFKTELETQCAILSSGLLALEEESDNAETQAELMRAAHSLKGAARIADLPAIVTVAHALEDCFVAAQEGRIPVGQSLIDLALEVNDWFGEAAQLEPEALEDALAKQTAKAEELQHRLEALLAGKPTETPLATPPPAAEPSPPAEEEQTWEVDESLLDLLKSELETQVAELNEQLLALEERGPEPEILSALMRAAHSVKGAGRIVGFDPMVRAAHTLEDYYDLAIRESRSELDQHQIDRTFAFCDLLQEGAGADAADFREVLLGLVPSFEAIASGESPQLTAAPASLPAAESDDLPQSEWQVDESLLDLLKSELETQSAELNTQLLALEEKGPDSQVLSALMRAAHSVKGAGRIVGFDPMVKAAHRIEDYFDRAGREKPDQLDQAEIDRTFAFCDLLQKAAETDLSRFKAVLMETVPEFERLAGERFDPPAPTVKQAVVAEEKPESASTPPEASKRPKRQEEDRALKVSAERMNRIMGLASEILVERNQFEPVVKGFLRIKSAKLDLARTLAQLQLVAGKEPQARELLMVAREQLDQGRRMINEQFDQLEAMNAQGMKLANQLYQETLSSRMRPFQEGVQGFPRLVRDISRQLNKRVKYELLGAHTRVDRDVLSKLEAPLNHIIRNGLDHGMEAPEERQAVGKPPEGRLTVEARHRAGMLLVTVQDDGRGIDPAKVRNRVIDRGLATADMLEKMTESEVLEFLFLPGFSTANQVSEISGRGVGLDVVQTMVQEEGGSVRVTSKIGSGTTFHLNLPVTRSVMRAMITEICGDPYGFPLARIERVLALPTEAIRQVEGRTFCEDDGANIGLVAAGEVLGLPPAQREREKVSLVIFEENNQRYAVEVDRILGERDCVVRPIDTRLGRIPDVSAVSIMEDGSPMWLIDVDDMVRSIDTLLSEGRLGRGRRAVSKGAEESAKRQVLVVDDSLTVREIERKLLERNGYEVDVAVDGMEGWNAARLGQYDLIVSDVDMPRMNGIEFIKRLRQDSRLVSVPVIIVSYKDREEDRLRGMEAGASHYLTKSSFQDDTFIETVEDLIGR